MDMFYRLLDHKELQSVIQILAGGLASRGLGLLLKQLGIGAVILELHSGEDKEKLYMSVIYL